ncbi:MAG: glycosyltransferase family 1 protein [Phycisphaerae bacterium]|nr:glycosyltransferase family 1 protein [Phycisphaerae bacterium]
MRILIATLGSAGDTHPYIAIGEELVRRGHAVAMLANPHFEGRIRPCGIEFFPLGEERDFLDVLHDPRLAQQGKSPYLVIQALFNKTVEPAYLAMQDAVRAFRPDAIVRHHILFAAGWVAEQHRIPCVTGVLTPSMWFHPDEPTILRSYLPRSVQRALAGPIRIGGKLALRWLIDRPVNRARKRLGLEPVRDVFFRESKGGDLVLGLWSKHFRPPLPGDPARSQVCGFCFFDRAGGEADRALEPRLERFVRACEDKGRAPILFTLGTTIVHHAGELFDVAVRASREIARPVVLLVGREGAAEVFKASSDVCVCAYAPHSLLMPRAAASVHHAGAGSAAQALRSGRPSVSVPFVNDEFDIAHRMQQLGASAYVPASKLRGTRAVRNLAEALRQVSETPSFLEASESLGNRIRGENGAKNAADAVESFASC